MFWNQEIETISRPDLEKLQLERLNKTMLHAASSPCYQQKWADMPIKPGEIKSLEQLREVPFTEKQDLRNGFPYGNLATPNKDVVRVHVSSGTTGVPTAVYHTQDDLDNWTDLVARCLFMVGMRPEDIFQNMIGYGLFTGGSGPALRRRTPGSPGHPLGRGQLLAPNQPYPPVQRDLHPRNPQLCP